ncbi:MAG TPA: tetraacyldisaccharide 4'-kinase [Bacteroidales bacterium]|nr:tetraacyldisaccharide 4'-kinase [Bacteroidales bacterium]
MLRHLLYPVSLVYGFVTAIRNTLYNTGAFRSRKFDIPVICVGNITVGGTGKTPHTEYVTGLLKNEFRTAVLSRGYMRKTSGFIVASASSGATEIGDEPAQIKLKYPELTVAVDSDRINGITRILEESPGTEVIVMDDGFQHRRLTPGFTILLTDYGRLMTRDHLLPYGRLRENVSNKRRAGVIVVTKTPPGISVLTRQQIRKEIDPLPGQSLFFTSLIYGYPMPVFSETTGFNPGPKGVLLLTGIANPEPLRIHLGKSFSEILLLEFPDHHNYTENDLKKIQSAYNNLKSQEKCIITTEKDAVRLREFTNIAQNLKSSFYYIPVAVGFPNDDSKEFDNLILEYVRKNKRNN